MDFHSSEIFQEIKKRDLSLVYCPLASHPYKVELKHESWRNVALVQKSGARFALISDHPVILQRTLFLTTRHLMRFGATKEQCIAVSCYGLSDDFLRFACRIYIRCVNEINAVINGLLYNFNRIFPKYRNQLL